MTLTLNLFGAFQLSRDGQPVKFATDYARALLAYLAVEGRPYERAALAALLWPGQPEPSARQSLRQTLLYLRQALGETERAQPVIVATTKTLQVQRDGIDSDVQRFQQLLTPCATHDHTDLLTCPACIERMQAAIDLYQGEFLHGFFVKGSQPFEEWALFLREQLHRQTLDACTILVEYYQAQGDARQVQHYAARQLAWEPWREAAHRQMMWALAANGQSGAALAQYATCCRMLAEELGAQPEAETTALYEQIRRGAFAKTTSAQLPSERVTTVHPVTPSPPPPPPTHNLPEPPTPLIGRAQAVVEIVEQLQRPEVRLLTLIGPGGMGKTRLAAAVGRECLGDFSDGVWFVPLTAINTPAALAPTIATALGLTLQGSDPHALLLQSLREKRLLLILDNFEHLLVEEVAVQGSPPQDAVDLVVDLLNSVPGVQILITSRERLKLRSEKLYTVQALAFAPEATLAAAAAAPAVRLFVQTVQRQQPGFQLTDENLATVLQICRLVQGMPLGLELAAANADLLPLTAIAEEIAQNRDFLAVDWRDMPERQRSMRAVFAWSWRLLDEQERQVFRQLAIFQGGFTYAAAEVIAGATLPVLARLAHKSLLQGSTLTAVTGRYLIHELLRQFAAAELADAGEETAVANRHSTYYLTFLAAQQPRIMHHAPREAVQAIQDELDNIRQAWRWGVGHLPAALVEQSALALREFYWLTGLTAEAIEMFTLAVQTRHTYLLKQQALSTMPEHYWDYQAEARVYSILLGLSGALQVMVGRHEEAFQHATEALQVASADANPAGVALGYMLQGQVFRRQGKSAEALRLLTQSVEIARQARAATANPSLLLDIEKRAYSWLASIALSHDDYALARTHSTYQLEICRQFQMRVGEVIALTCLIDVDKALGDYGRAQQNAEHALATAYKVNFLWGQAICLEHLAEFAWVQGDYQQAQSLYEQTLAFFRNMNRSLEEATVSHMLGRLHLWLGDANRAHTWIDQAFQLLEILGFPARETFWATSSRARLYYLTGDPAQALVDAEQAWTMAQQLDGGASQADALVLLGLVYESLHQTDEAATAYREAVTIYLTLGHHHRTAAPRAGLARLALADDALASALTEIEEVLAILLRHPLAGFDEPFQVYLTCYTVLAAHQDERAATILATAHELLTRYAERILDPAVRRTFLENVAIHRELVEAYTKLQAQAAKVGANVLASPVNGD